MPLIPAMSTARIVLDQRSYQPSSRELVLPTRTEGISVDYTLCSPFTARAVR
jgi:hypothetical protein